jgi:hypothetical protein
MFVLGERFLEVDNDDGRAGAGADFLPMALSCLIVATSLFQSMDMVFSCFSA